MKRFILSCKKATWLLSLKEEGKLSIVQKLQLRAHIGVCGMCKLFEKQTALISHNARHSHTHSTKILSAERTALIDQKLRELINDQEMP